MSNPYTSQSASNYNASPPPDDGSQTASNEVTWAGIKTKLADPIKTLADAINTAVSNAFGAIFGNSTNAQSSTYTVQTSDRGKVISCTNSITINLLAAATAGDGFVIIVKNEGTGTVTIDGSGSETIDGATTKLLQKQYDSVVIQCNGSNWRVLSDGGTDEGSWTPAIGGASTAGTQTYSTQVGRYLRIGNLVTIWFNIAISAKDGTTAGNLQVTGLPFTASTVSGLRYAMATAYGSFDLSAGYTQIGGYIDTAAAVITLIQTGDNVGASVAAAANLIASSQLVGSVTYRIN